MRGQRRPRFLAGVERTHGEGIDRMAEAERCPVALVTGGSRGIGAATVQALAARGYDVALTYRNKAARAERVAAEARARGVAALTIGGDMTQPDDLARLLAELSAWRGRLDALILNASGGLERDALASDPGYPMRINRDAQVALAEGALPLMRAGGAIVLVTSHWAVLYGRTPQLPAYEEVARSKHAGEEALRDRMPQFTARGVRLAIVTGDVIEGTVTPRLLERVTPGLTAQRRETVGDLPSVEQMGEAIADAATDGALPSGSLVVIGGSLESMLG
jgi:NAD(P)-dependent dehydrogenase (short-subunit alcohol dehydrogenase family)